MQKHPKLNDLIFADEFGLLKGDQLALETKIVRVLSKRAKPITVAEIRRKAQYLVTKYHLGHVELYRFLQRMAGQRLLVESIDDKAKPVFELAYTNKYTGEKIDVQQINPQLQEQLVKAAQRTAKAILKQREYEEITKEKAPIVIKKESAPPLSIPEDGITEDYFED